MRKRRGTLRLPGKDYSSPEHIFVTICIRDRIPVLGRLENRAVHFLEPGRIAQQEWCCLSERYPSIALDRFVIMPDHVHGIVVLGHRPWQEGRSPRLGEIIRTFKAATTYRIRRIRQGFGWQRGYHDRIIRTPAELGRIRRYIERNPDRSGVPEAQG